MLDRHMKAALDALPNIQLWRLADMIRAMPPAPALAWLDAAVGWERRRRSGQKPGEFPMPDIASERLADAMLLLRNMGDSFRAYPTAAEFSPTVRVLDAAVEFLVAIQDQHRAQRQ